MIYTMPQTNCGVFAPLLCAVERRVLIRKVLHTAGCCHCLADFEITIRQQSESQSLSILYHPWPPVCLFVDFFYQPSLIIPIYRHFPLISPVVIAIFCLTENALTSSNTSDSMVLILMLCLSSPSSTNKLSWEKIAHKNTHLYLNLRPVLCMYMRSFAHASLVVHLQQTTNIICNLLT